MPGWLSRLWPRSLVGRTVLVLLLGLAVSHLISVAVYTSDRFSVVATTRSQQLAERIAAVVRLVEEAPPVERGRLLRAPRGPWPGALVVWSAESPLSAGEADDWRTRLIRRELAEHLGGLAPGRVRFAYQDAARVAAEVAALPRHGAMHRPGPWAFGDPGATVMRVSVQLVDGSWLTFAAPVGAPPAFWTSRTALSGAVMAVLVIVLSVWAVRRASRPLGALAAAAERLGRDINAPPIPEKGPREVHQAARAFNDMQRRLQAFVRDRTQMLAAISHDLRTPITRLRLRAELIDDAEQQRKMLADLEEMETMIAATLAFARDDAAAEPRRPLDLAALLQSVVDDATDAGRPAAYAGPPHLSVVGAPVALRRAFANLVDNAVKYGATARVGLAGPAAGHVTVTVDDDGPGLPPEEMEKVFSPFYRVEKSRSRETGGVGLGLAVVRSVVRAHGGEVVLRNRPGGGLMAAVTLPAD
jgi:signal transduction histidine kinase